jgi:hypothetical protein
LAAVSEHAFSYYLSLLPTLCHSPSPQLPNHDFSNQTIIITGSNTGLDFEAAKHFLAHHCATLITAVRNTSKGESAKKSLLDTLPNITSSQI